MMTMLAITATLIGAVLGLRFTASILARAFVIGSTAALVVGLAYGDGLWSMLLAMVLTITALQMGYLGGVVIRLIIEGMRIRETSPTIIAVSLQPVRRTRAGTRPENAAGSPA